MSEIPSGIIGALVSLTLLFALLVILILAIQMGRMAEDNRRLREQVQYGRVKDREIVGCYRGR